MSVITIRPGDQVTKDPSDAKVYVFDWDTQNLGAGVIIATSEWSITPIRPSLTDALLLDDSDSILAGTRKTHVRLTGGTYGQIYEVANRITTNETPSQTKERSFRILIEQQ
jgi:hypothetical protein